MSLLTLLCRLPDGLMLAESLESSKSQDIEYYRTQAKQILKTLSLKSVNKLTIDSGDYYFAYMIENDVCYLTLCEKLYPKKLAFTFLEELQKEFDTSYGSEIKSAKRPYAFVQFDTFIQKTKKLYQDTRTQRNLSKLTEDLADVHKIMSSNIKEILGRGEKIDSVASKSEVLLHESSKFEKEALSLSSKMFWKTYGPLFVVLAIVLLLLYARYYFW
eukprot:TRINITY_DN8143_c1_g1_i1.p1 TRINITY_DN8143_c1_g1~~TRINITY_DN8143_c1_g1_i1.p1  ORF type:complete len:216 (-),score=35.18 TRINITY_DN8143_c1_g1_i1:99-746(-)